VKSEKCTIAINLEFRLGTRLRLDKTRQSPVVSDKHGTSIRGGAEKAQSALKSRRPRSQSQFRCNFFYFFVLNFQVSFEVVMPPSGRSLYAIPASEASLATISPIWDAMKELSINTKVHYPFCPTDPSQPRASSLWPLATPPSSAT
jgi:hypothetical protein